MTDPTGKRYDAHLYAVGREKVREYALAVGEASPLHHDPAVARKNGFRDVVAPPMFAVVFCSRPMAQAIFDPEVGIDFSRMVHGAQEFAWHAPIVAGDEIATEVTFLGMTERDGRKFFTHETRSTNQDGELVVVGTWTQIVR
jgi:acyl dehydratase